MKQEVYTDLEPIKEFAPIEEKVISEHSYLHDWVFHFNAYTEYWHAIPRDGYNEYWSDSKDPRVIKSRDFYVLLQKVKNLS